MECKMNPLKPYQLTGAVGMYEATGEESFKDYVLDRLNCLEDAGNSSESSLPSEDARAYFFALEQTGDEKYRQKTEQLEASFAQKGWTAECMPFITAYETSYKRKEHYNEIADFFRKMDRFTGDDLVALIETVGEMSQEIYEYYRELRDLFKTVIKEKIRVLPDSPEGLEIGYSILKACNMGVLQKEKYGEIGVLAGKNAKDSRDGVKSGLWEMFEAQAMIINEVKSIWN